jgi:hypothetical protein
MKGLYQVTARRASKIITSEVYGNIAEKDVLFNRLMTRHKIPHARRHEWKLQEVKLNKEIND